MTQVFQTHLKRTSTQRPSFTPAPSGFLQRKCACGGSATKGGECEECAKKRRLSLQRYSISREQPMLGQLPRTSLGVGFGHTFARLPLHAPGPSAPAQTEVSVSKPGDRHEREAEAMAAFVTRTAVRPSAPAVALSPARVAIHREQAAGDNGASSSGGRIIVEDSETELGPGQVTKSAFLAQLRPALERSGLSADHQSQMEAQLSAATRESASELERDIQRYAPETVGAQTADDIVNILVSRARALAGSATAAGPSSTEEERVAFMSGEGVAAAKPDSPQGLQAEMGAGRPLESSTRSRMESAFGRSFAGVQLHCDSTGATLAGRYNARAFALGRHIAFGAGEYRPGTLEGDVLIAHELAHVVQQGEAGGAVSSDSSSDQAMEDDADRSAVSVMARLTGFTGKLPDAKTAMTRLKSGLRLQRCPPTSGTRRTINYQGMSEGAAFGGNCTYCSCESGVPREIEMISRRKQQGDRCPPGVTVDWNGNSAVSATALSQNPCPGAPSGCMGPPNFVDK